MARQQGWCAHLLALVISAILICISLPFQLGLDLRGGSQLTLEVQPLNASEQINSKYGKSFTFKDKLTCIIL